MANHNTQSLNCSEKLSLDDVVGKFPDLINAWCEQQHKLTKKPRTEMCVIAVNQFSDVFSPDYIRKNILPNYKIGYRQRNAKKTWIKTKVKKITDKINDLNDELEETLIEGTIYSKEKR